MTDSITGAALHPEFDLEWASGEPTKKMGKRTGDPFCILVPANVDLRMVVQCQGYKPWVYPGTIRVEPGHDLELTIKMDADPAAKR